MTIAEPGDGITDLHSHLVPGVDDGSRTIEDALEAVQRMIDREVSTIVTTPHLSGLLTRRRDDLETRLADVDRAFAEVAEAIRARHPELTFLRGHEVMLDCPDPDLSDPRMRLANSDVVLVEWPGLRIPLETPRVLEGLQRQGVRLLIAHVERYRGYDQELALVEAWRAEGAMLQANCGALCGRYGEDSKVRMLRMLERGWVDCLASDFHGRPHLRVHMECARRVFEELHADEAWRLLTRVNPARIVGGAKPLPVPPIEGEPGLLGKVLSLFRS